MRDFHQPGRSAVYARHAMVATSHPLATDVGIDILKSGGNAFDAALAAVVMQCVVEPQSTGIGGDCFCLYAPGGQGTPLAFNGSGRAPAAASVAALHALGVERIERGSAHAVVVPGAVDAWLKLHQDHASVPLAELFAPAIAAARDGFAISPRVRFDFEQQRDYIAGFPRAQAIYYLGGEAPAVGSVLRLPLLADALESIAREGRRSFYEGELAEDMVAELASRGGLHTLEDFRRAEGEYVEPIRTRFRDLDVLECPPNGQGVIALLLLNMLSALEPPRKSGDVFDIERVHLEIEACRIAYRIRDQILADPAQAAVPLEQLLSPEFAREQVLSIDPHQAREQPRTPFSPHRDTVTVNVVDAQRNSCSLINTLFDGFGSGITSSLGVTLSNRGMSFSLDAESPNAIAPHKRPRHTILPGMAYREGRVALCFGVMGGEYQAFGHMQFLSRLLDHQLDVQQAIDLPRFMVNLQNGVVQLERGVPDRVREGLSERGHRLETPTSPIGGAQAILIDSDNDVLVGGSDPRKDGCAAGY